MSAPAFRSRWSTWRPGDAISSLVAENALTQLTQGPHRPPSVSSVSSLRAGHPKHADPFETAAPVAVLLRGTIWGDLWLIADDDVLPEHQEITASGLPVVRFAELPHLQRLDAEALRALGLVQRTFPTARVLQ